MAQSNLIRWLALAATTIVFACCQTSYEVTKRSELNLADRPSEITILTKSDTEYTLQTYKLLDSSIYGTGYAEKNDSRKNFNGKIPISEIKSITAYETNWMKSIALVGITSVSVYAILAIAGSNPDMENEVHIIYPSGPGPCSKPRAGGNNDVPVKFRSLLEESINSGYLIRDQAVVIEICKGSEKLTMEVTDKGDVIEVRCVKNDTVNPVKVYLSN